LKDFAKNRKSIEDEFKHIPQVTARIDDVPDNVAEKNRFANVLPLSQTRVMLKRINDDEKSEYINANYVKGTKDTANYYIATQAPLESTISDFWRMMWEQNSRVIIMLTDFHENGIEKCAQYVPASVIIDNTQTFGDFEVTLKSREVKGKYALSKIHLKNLQSKTWREITHFWYSWPERGCPTDEMSIINLLLEARTFLKTASADNLDENSNMDDKDKVSTLDKSRSLQKFQG
jgi:protein tyrosine phosphatase